MVVPEIADYEVRRELLRAIKPAGITRLDGLGDGFGYLPIVTQAMHFAARLWADARRAGRHTAADAALDGDVILAAQALVLAQQHADVVIATTNTEHLARYAPARLWRDI